MNIFVLGSADLPVATQIQFTNAICFVFFVPAILAIPAIIVLAMRVKEGLDHKKGRPGNSWEG